MAQRTSRHRVQGTASRVLTVLAIAAVVSAHIGSPDVFFTGKAGKFDVSVVVRPPEVVPGVARVTVQLADAFQGRVTIRPVYWRAGSKGAPSADDMRRLNSSGMFEGSLWLMARGAYSVDVTVISGADSANVLVPVASVATGRLALNTPLAAVLVVLGAFLLTGLVNIVRKGAGESLLEAGKSLSDNGVRTSRIAGGVAVAVLALVIFGGARWWSAVDDDYQRTIYRPSSLAVSLTNGMLRVAASDTQRMPDGSPSTYVPDHGKLMHLFLVGDSGFAHLHPLADSSHVPAFTTNLPALPAGTYRIYGDVVQETGFERTMVGSVQIPEKSPAAARMDYNDGWLVGKPTSPDSARLADGSIMQFFPDHAPITAQTGLTLRVFLKDAKGGPAYSEPYLGMDGHMVITRPDGSVYTHLHPMGTVSAAAQEVFQARDRGDTTNTGKLRAALPGPHAGMTMPGQTVTAESRRPFIDFPYAFPKAGEYRVYVQIMRNQRVLTGAFAVTVAAQPAPAK